VATVVRLDVKETTWPPVGAATFNLTRALEVLPPVTTVGESASEATSAARAVWGNCATNVLNRKMTIARRLILVLRVRSASHSDECHSWDWPCMYIVQRSWEMRHSPMVRRKPVPIAVHEVSCSAPVREYRTLKDAWEYQAGPIISIVDVRNDSPGE
jgi:hypothetical protein